MTPTGLVRHQPEPVAADRIAVIVVNYNAGDYLQRCLNQLANQTSSPGMVIVVDNASEDGSANDLSCGKVPLQVMRLTENLGFAAANNRAVEQCAYPWIVLLNPDAFAHPDWLESLVRDAGAFPKTCVFASRQMMVADDIKSDIAVERIDGAGDIYHTSGLAWRRGHGKPLSSRYLAQDSVFGPCAAAALYAREAYVDVGGFDEQYFCYFEDVDLAYRLQLAGYETRYLPAAVVDHIGSATTGEGSDFSIYHGHRNMVWTYVKNTPRGLVWRTLPLHLLINLVTLVVYSLKGRAKPIWRAKRDALRALPRVFAQRRAIQSRYRNSLISDSQQHIPSPYMLRLTMARGVLGLWTR